LGRSLLLVFLLRLLALAPLFDSPLPRQLRHRRLPLRASRHWAPLPSSPDKDCPTYSDTVAASQTSAQEPERALATPASSTAMLRWPSAKVGNGSCGSPVDRSVRVAEDVPERLAVTLCMARRVEG